MTEGNKSIAVGAFSNLFLSLIKFSGGFLAIVLPWLRLPSILYLISLQMGLFISHMVWGKFLLIKITHMVMGAPKP